MQTNSLSPKSSKKCTTILTLHLQCWCSVEHRAVKILLELAQHHQRKLEREKGQIELGADVLLCLALKFETFVGEGRKSSYSFFKSSSYKRTPRNGILFYASADEFRVAVLAHLAGRSVLFETNWPPKIPEGLFVSFIVMLSIALESFWRNRNIFPSRWLGN